MSSTAVFLIILFVCFIPIIAILICAILTNESQIRASKDYIHDPYRGYTYNSYDWYRKGR